MADIDMARTVIKTDPDLKRKAVAVASELHLSLNFIINNELRRLVAEKRVIVPWQEEHRIHNRFTRAVRVPVPHNVVFRINKMASRNGLEFNMQVISLLHRAVHELR